VGLCLPPRRIVRPDLAQPLFDFIDVESTLRRFLNTGSSSVTEFDSRIHDAKLFSASISDEKVWLTGFCSNRSLANWLLI
jgi:hypothetical protein